MTQRWFPGVLADEPVSCGAPVEEPVGALARPDRTVEVSAPYPPESSLPEGAGFIIGPMIGAALWLVLILAHFAR